jgi:hypothetical protein
MKKAVGRRWEGSGGEEGVDGGGMAERDVDVSKRVVYSVTS